MIKRPARSDVADQQDALPLRLRRDLVKEGDDASHCLTPTLSLREGLVESPRPFHVQLLARHAVQGPVVALAETPVE